VFRATEAHSFEYEGCLWMYKRHEARDDTSTVVVVTSKPASLNVFAAASAFSWRGSASRTCLPALTDYKKLKIEIFTKPIKMVTVK
jgi:hypothetical protein